MLFKKGYLIKDREQSALAESFRSLRMSLQTIKDKHGINSILIAGCSKGSSASQALVNVAAALAYAGNRVVVVDADFRSPSFRSYFLTSKAGITDVLTGACSLAQAVYASNVENLHIIPAGTHLQSPLTMLTDKMLPVYLKELEMQFDFVLVNAPEILISAKSVQSDACILASKIQGTILFIDSRQVRVQTAQKAIDLIRGTKANLLGVILGNVEIGNVFFYPGVAEEMQGTGGG